MKKILFFLESLAGGGAEKVLTDIVCHLDKSKYDITVCTVTDGGVYQQQVSAVCHYRSLLHIADYQAGGLKKVLFWLKMKMIYTLPSKTVYHYFFKEHYDIEVAFIEGFATKLIASSQDKSSKIAWLHVDLEQNPWTSFLYKSVMDEKKHYDAFDKIVCVSESVKESFIRKYGISADKVIVQYNPVDKKTILKRAQEPISCQIPQGKMLLGTIGRLEEVKGYLRLLKCAKKLRDKGYSFALWIIGEGSQRKQLEQYILENNLKNTVSLLGFQTNPYKYLNQCDAFICSSYSEGFSTAATESLILGKPVFTVNCAGMRELIGESNCGKIVPNTDEDLYLMLEEVVSGRIDMDEYKRNAEKRGEAFDLDLRIDEIENLLSTL